MLADSAVVKAEPLDCQRGFVLPDYLEMDLEVWWVSYLRWKENGFGHEEVALAELN